MGHRLFDFLYVVVFISFSTSEYQNNFFFWERKQFKFHIDSRERD